MVGRSEWGVGCRVYQTVTTTPSQCRGRRGCWNSRAIPKSAIFTVPYSDPCSPCHHVFVEMCCADQRLFVPWLRKEWVEPTYVCLRPLFLGRCHVRRRVLDKYQRASNRTGHDIYVLWIFLPEGLLEQVGHPETRNLYCPVLRPLFVTSDGAS